MYKDRATSYVTKKHKKAYRQSILAKMKDKNTEYKKYTSTITL